MRSPRGKGKRIKSGAGGKNSKFIIERVLILQPTVIKSLRGAGEKKPS